MGCKGKCINIRDGKAPRGRLSYKYGGKYCSTCEAAYITDLKHCECCGCTLRYTPSNSNYRFLGKPKIKPARDLRLERQKRYYYRHREQRKEHDRKRCLAYYYRKKKLIECKTK